VVTEYNCSWPSMRGQSVCHSEHGAGAALEIENCAGLDPDGNETQCVFPFTFENKLYSSCTFAGGEQQFQWCATEVDGRGAATNQGVCTSCGTDLGCSVVSFEPETPTPLPTPTPTHAPTPTPTVTPTDAPTAAPTTTPTAAPTAAPTTAPTTTPTTLESLTPTTQDFEVHMIPGYYPSEVSWRIDDADVVPYSPQVVVVALTSGPHTLYMIDSFGDGWDVASWSLKQSDVTVQGPFTLSVGAIATQVFTAWMGPTTSPTASPTAAPTAPTAIPTDSPSPAPSVAPTTAPTLAPTAPTAAPTAAPTPAPTAAPTTAPSPAPALCVFPFLHAGQSYSQCTS
jgi:hypothetical protein